MNLKLRVLAATVLCGGHASYQRVLSFQPLSTTSANFYALIHRLSQEGLIKRNSRPGRFPARLSIVQTGFDYLHHSLGPRAYRLSQLSSPTVSLPQWQWCVLIVFPRSGNSGGITALQKLLARFGSARIRSGVFISAWDIWPTLATWLEEHRMLSGVLYTRIGRSTPVSRVLSPEAFWGLQNQAVSYQNLIDRLSIVRGLSTPGKRESGLRRIRSDFLSLILTDPLLPEQLLPPSWPLATVKRLLDEALTSS